LDASRLLSVFHRLSPVFNPFRECRLQAATSKTFISRKAEIRVEPALLAMPPKKV